MNGNITVVLLASSRRLDLLLGGRVRVGVVGAHQYRSLGLGGRHRLDPNRSSHSNTSLMDACDSVGSSRLRFGRSSSFHRSIRGIPTCQHPAASPQPPVLSVDTANLIHSTTQTPADISIHRNRPERAQEPHPRIEITSEGRA